MIRCRVAALVLVWSCCATSVVAQQEPRPLRVSSAVMPETVTVGERFRSVLRIEGAPAAVEFTQPTAGDTLQPTDSLQVLHGEASTAVFSLVAWHTGADLSASVPVRVEMPGGEFVTHVVPLRLPVVRSVLPDDTAAIALRPHRAVMSLPAGAGFPVWLWIVLALALLAFVLALIMVRVKRGRDEVVTPESARERARHELAMLHSRGLVDVAEHRRLYPAVTRVLRDYLSTVDQRWGTDLTSAELIRVVAAAPGHGTDAAELERVLSHADAVKFARRTPSEDELQWFWASVGLAIERIPLPEVEPADAEVAA